MVPSENDCLQSVVDIIEISKTSRKNAECGYLSESLPLGEGAYSGTAQTLRNQKRSEPIISLFEGVLLASCQVHHIPEEDERKGIPIPNNPPYLYIGSKRPKRTEGRSIASKITLPDNVRF